MMTRKEREALDAREAEESIAAVNHEAYLDEIERLRRQRHAVKEMTFVSRYNALPNQQTALDWALVERLGRRLYWYLSHPFGHDLAAVAETNS